MNEFPHTATLQEYTETKDGYGGTTKTWSNVKVIQCHIQPLHGDEYYKAQQLQNKLDFNVYTPYDDVITTNMRLKYNGDVLNIIGPPLDEGGLNEILLLKCGIE